MKNLISEDYTLASNEQFWNSKKIGKRIRYTLDLAGLLNLLHNRGFCRVLSESGEYRYAIIKDKNIWIIDRYDIRRFVFLFACKLEEREVKNMLFRGGDQYLGNNNLSKLKLIEFTENYHIILPEDNEEDNNTITL